MLQQDSKIPVTFIVGPTAVGKTAFAIDFAKAVHGEIISADSRYFYRGMNIGTAKPSAEEMSGVPHHLIDVADPDETWSLAMFQQRAVEIAAEIHSRQKAVIIVGGTGQYIRALLEGWLPPEQEPSPILRSALEHWAEQLGAEELYQKLRVIDPEAAAHIDYQNLRRTIRAFEVIFSTGRRFSDQRQKAGCPFRPLVIGLIRNRQELYQRIDQRVDRMFQSGLLCEAQRLLDKGYSPDLPSMSAIGYKEAVQCIRGTITEAEAAALIKRRTRNYVRRQSNWFKPDDPSIFWYDISG